MSQHNFWPAPTTPTGVSFYQPTSGDSINLREELRGIFHGTATESAKAHWIVLRKMDLTKRSQYWNEETLEAIGGPAYEYTDIVVRTRRRINDSHSVQDEMQSFADPGQIHVTTGMYFFEHDVKPKKEDEIFEIDYDLSICPTAPRLDRIPYPYKEKHIIRESIPLRLDQGGRTEYWACYVRRDYVE